MSVYFVTARRLNRVKIGCATNPRARLSSLQTASAVELKLEAVLPGYSDEERELHERFARYRIRGEWFALTGELEDFIRTAPAPATEEAAVVVEMRPRRKTDEELVEESLALEHATYAEHMAWRERLDRGLIPELQT